MKVNSIIFDLDGTLLNTLDDLYVSVNYMLDKFGYPKRTKSEVRSYLGSGVRYLVNCALPDGAKERTDECLAVFKEYYDVHKDDNTAPYEGIIDMLAEVKAAGIKTAIVSNKYDAAVQQLKEVTFTGGIDFALGEGNGIKPKPAPDGVWLAMDKIGATKDDCIYVGDSEVDMQTADNAGLRCVTVSWGFRDKEDLLARGALNCIDYPNELMPLIVSGDIK